MTFRYARPAPLAMLAILMALVTLALSAGAALADQGESRRDGFLDSRIAVQADRSCAITGDGNLYCWGLGGYLGYGHTQTIGDDEDPVSAGPVNLGLNARATAVTMGEQHTCAILDNGTVKCWGTGAGGRLGYGNTNTIGDDEVPGSQPAVDIGAGRTAVDISASGSHTCVILDDGTVRCWGGGGASLGYGNTNTIGDDETPGSVGPVSLGAGRTAVAIATGPLHSCAILDNGSVRCWGNNSWNQLGLPGSPAIGDNELPSAAPTVNLGAGRTAVAISAADRQTCAILDNGGVKCWGTGNEWGLLGYADGKNVKDPSTVGTLDIGTGRTAVAISAGYNHSCVVLDNGDTRCWGINEWGLLGNGNTPLWGAGWIGDDETPGSVDPIYLGDGRRAVDVATSPLHTCALLDNGQVRCWGAARYGRLGVPFPEENPELIIGVYIGDDERPGDIDPVDLGSHAGAIEVVAGEAHSCALFEAGTVRCWGKGADGRLGYGNTATIGDNENAGAGGDVPLGGTAVKLAAGKEHTCAVLSEGSVRCWGKGADGRLGYGNTDSIGDDETPAAVPPVDIGGTAIGITAGGSHTCALLATGAIRCWGLGASGQLGYANAKSIGDDEAPASVGPVTLAVGRSAVGVTAGESHTCAVLDDHTTRCWGKGADGRLGYSNTTTIGDDEVGGTGGAVSIGRTALSTATGGSHSCAALTDGTMRCWGLGTSGRLGYASTSTIGDDELPSSVGTVGLGRNATFAAAGDAHSCARLDSGAVRCWGLGSNGRLGYANTTTIGDNELPSAAGPVVLGGTHAAQSLAAGGAHTCVTLEDGTVRCWGLNSDGQLGLGNTQDVGDDETPGSVPVVDLVDDPPTAVNNSAVVAEDAAATAIDVLANDTDVDGGPRSIVSVSQPSHGTVTITGGGSGLTYKPDADYCNDPPGTSPDTFSYTLTPGGSTATVSVKVTCVDDPPTAVNNSAVVAEDAAATAIDVLANDTDVDGGPRSIVSVSQPSHGTVTITGGGSGLTYKPDADYCNDPPGTSPDTFSYTLTPGGSTATVSVKVTCVDDPPTAVNDNAVVAEDAAATAIDVLANDTDVDGGPKSIASVTQPPHGTVAITGGGSGLTYEPDADYCNDPPGTSPDAFTYTLNGGSTATVSVKVNCVDDPPIAVDDEFTVPEDASATALAVLANDTDIDDGPKSIDSVTQPANGTVVITGGGSGLTYTPDADYCNDPPGTSPDTFTYTLAPGGSTATVSLEVTCVDDPPVAVDDEFTVMEDASTTALAVLANDTDPDGGPRSISSVSQPPRGTVAISGDGTGLTYKPDAGVCGNDTFTYRLSPGASVATVIVHVTCVDDPPLAVDDSVIVVQGSAANAVDVLANDTDPDGGPKSIASRSAPQHGSANLLSGGSGLTYTPDPGYCGPDSFTYSLAPGGSTATVAVTVICVETGGGGGTTQVEGSSQTTITAAQGPIVNVTPGVGVISGRRKPRIAIKGSYAFFTLTCKLKSGECVGRVQIRATIPSLTLGPTTKALRVVAGGFRIGAGRSVLVRAKMTRRGRTVLRGRRTLRGVFARMAIRDTRNGERGEIDVNLVRRPKASLLK